jgi:hypothetical protein
VAPRKDGDIVISGIRVGMIKVSPKDRGMADHTGIVNADGSPRRAHIIPVLPTLGNTL